MTYQQTSRGAYADVLPGLGRRQSQVLEELQRKPRQTNKELSYSLHWLINEVTPRVLELRKLGKVRHAGDRACKITGKLAMTWEPVVKVEQLTLLN
jgi:hypothetical protein